MSSRPTTPIPLRLKDDGVMINGLKVNGVPKSGADAVVAVLEAKVNVLEAKVNGV